MLLHQIVLMHGMSKKQNINKIGPVQLIAFGFPPNAKYEGKILKELERLDSIKTIRLLDLLFIKKDEETDDLLVVSIEEEEMGAIVGAIMGFKFDGEQIKQRKSEIDSDNRAFGLTQESIEKIGQSLEPGMAAGVILIEHVWAKELKQAIRDTGGVPIVEGFLTQEVIATVANELEAITTELDEQEIKESKAKNGIHDKDSEHKSRLIAHH